MATVKTKEALHRAEAQFRKRELAAREGEAVRAEQWIAARRKVDPNGVFASDMARRLELL